MAGATGEYGWFKLDEQYFANPKIQAAGPAGWSLHLAMCAWSSAHRTDGVVPDGVLSMLAGQAKSRRSNAEKLESLLLIHRTHGGYVLHDWECYIRSRESVEKDRVRWRNSKRRQRVSTVDMAVDSTEESHAESTAVSLGKQSKEKNDLHLPTTDTSGGGHEGGRGKAVLELMVRHERSQTTSDVRDEKAWTTRVRTNLAERHGAEIERVCARFPDAPCDVVAGYVRGESTSIRYYDTADL